MKWSDRSTADLLVLLIAGTVCFVVLATGLTLSAIEIWQPEKDTSAGASAISDVVSALIGLLAGFLAGRGTNGKPPPPP